MTSTDTVHWLYKEMQGALGIRLPVVGCSDWPSPAEADPPELTRTLDEADAKRAIDLAHRRGISRPHIDCVFRHVTDNYANGHTVNWIADLIDILDSLPPRIQSVKGGRL